MGAIEIVELMFPSAYLKAADLKGKDGTVTISGVVQEPLVLVGGKKETKWIISFAEMDKRPKDQRKRLVASKTNIYRIAWHLGNRFGDWVGQKICIGPREVPFGKETVDAIRVLKTPKLRSDAGRSFRQTEAQWKRWWSL